MVIRMLVVCVFLVFRISMVRGSVMVSSVFRVKLGVVSLGVMKFWFNLDVMKLLVNYVIKRLVISVDRIGGIVLMKCMERKNVVMVLFMISGIFRVVLIVLVLKWIIVFVIIVMMMGIGNYCMIWLIRFVSFRISIRILVMMKLLMILLKGKFFMVLVSMVVLGME